MMSIDRLVAGNYDPVHVNAIMIEARRMRNAALLGLLRRLFGWRGEGRPDAADAGDLAAAGT